MNQNAKHLMREILQQNQPKQLAELLGISLSTLYKWTEETENGRRSPLEFLELLVKAPGGERLVERLCEQAGGKFVRGEKLRVLACEECQQLIAKLEALMQLGAGGKPVGNRKLEIGNGRGRACRYRRANGRCGWKPA